VCAFSFREAPRRNDGLYPDLQSEATAGPNGDLQNEATAASPDLQNEATAGRFGDQQNQATAAGLELKNEAIAGGFVDLQNEVAAGDKGHPSVDQPPPPTAHLLLPTVNKTNPSHATPRPGQSALNQRTRSDPESPDAFRPRISLASSVRGIPDHRSNRKERRKHGKKKGR
jgi:hypothetical protein